MAAKKKAAKHEYPAEIGLNPKVQERLSLLEAQIARVTQPLRDQRVSIVMGVCLQNGIDLNKVDYMLAPDGTKLVRGKPKKV